jgi:hypothetical protein
MFASVAGFLQHPFQKFTSDFGLEASSTIMIILHIPSPFLYLEIRSSIAFTFPGISSLIAPAHFPHHAAGDCQGGHVVLDLQQGHGTRC